jgi:hypothetical protein
MRRTSFARREHDRQTQSRQVGEIGVELGIKRSTFAKAPASSSRCMGSRLAQRRRCVDHQRQYGNDTHVQRRQKLGSVCRLPLRSALDSNEGAPLLSAPCWSTGKMRGTLRLYRLPAPDRAAIIRDTLDIRKRAELDPEELKRRGALGKQLAQAQESTVRVAWYPEPMPGAAPIFDAEPAKSTGQADQELRGASSGLLAECAPCRRTLLGAIATNEGTQEE